jgi:hypothetical protein
MEQRDYFMREIDKMAQMLSIIFSKLLSLKAQNQVLHGIEVTNQSLKTEIDLDIDSIINIPSDEFINALLEIHYLKPEHISELANILYIIAEEYYNSQTTSEQGINLFQKCLKVYEFLNNTRSTYSIDVHFKIERIKNILKVY